MEISRETVQYIMENLTRYDYEYGRGARYQTMTFPVDGHEHDVKFYLANDIREWLFTLLHQGYRTFLPEDLPKGYQAEDLKRCEIRCSCGFVAGFDINHEAKTFPQDEQALRERYDTHLETEKEKMMERFQYE